MKLCGCARVARRFFQKIEADVASASARPARARVARGRARNSCAVVPLRFTVFLLKNLIFMFLSILPCLCHFFFVYIFFKGTTAQEFIARPRATRARRPRTRTRTRNISLDFLKKCARATAQHHNFTCKL